MTKILMPVAILFLLFATSCKEGWTEESKQQYKESCIESARTTFPDAAKAEAYCNCSIDVVMKKYPTIADYMEHVDSLLVDQDLIKCKTDLLNQ